MTQGPANPSFECATCGQTHGGLPAITFYAPLPFLFDADDEEARAQYQLTADTCIWADQDFFLRGVLTLPIRDSDFDLEFGVWMSVSPEDFDTYEAAGDELQLEPMLGLFASRMPGYPDTLMLNVKAHPQTHAQRPLFELEPTDHPLARQQREGISLREAVAYLHEQFPDGW